MFAAENGALPQGKVGGMGDVVRDLPIALARSGVEVTVVTPAYGMHARLPGAARFASLAVPFGGNTETVDRYRVPSRVPGVEYQLLDHPRFTPYGEERIYHDDGPDAPFYTDAAKFAFFSAAAAAATEDLDVLPDVVHLHDWHLGTYLALRAFDRHYRRLQSVRTVFTIHNIALQGTRPLHDTPSSWSAWFPWLRYRWQDIVDPVRSHCVNPMAIAIRLADMVNTVSPTYAEEIRKPSSPGTGFSGGERLEALLEAAHGEGRLVGILNGCEYSDAKPQRLGWKKLLDLVRSDLKRWIAADESVASAHYLAEERLAALGKKRPRTLLTCIGRITGQKVALFREPVADGVSALDRILAKLDKHDLAIVLGSGDPSFERFFTEASVRHANLLFLRGYSDTVAAALYASGDIFLMPSSFEPCGISQLLAMRSGQPCVVHAVGGLKDTVDGTTGFPFAGDTPQSQARNFAREVAVAVSLRQTDPDRWRRLAEAAAAARFDWESSARRYIQEVYGLGAG